MPQRLVGVFLQDPDVTILQGDSLELLRSLPSESVHMACTSPPFYGLRNYGVNGQIGLETTPDQWAARLVEVCRELRRVLRSDGTLWLEIGDSYAASGIGRNDAAGLAAYDEKVGHAVASVDARSARRQTGQISRPIPAGYKPKDLIGAPFLLAVALRADGWYWRDLIIWVKPNPMPESVNDRTTKSHSYVLLLTKSARYFYDAEAIKEPHNHDGRQVTQVVGQNGSLQHRDGERWPGTGRNRRSVWTIPTQPYPEAHFATWPEKLVEPMILAGSPEGGTVLDPFGGAGTTAVVARKLNRKAILLELNPDYCALAAKRLAQQSLFAV